MHLDRITVDPVVCLGQPTIRGLRITVSVVVRMLAAGKSRAEILQAYPELEEQDLVQALEYAAWLASEHTLPAPTNGVVGSGS